LGDPSCARLQSPAQLHWINVYDESGAERAPRSVAIKEESTRLFRGIF